MIDRDKLAREAIDLNKQIAKLEVRSRKLTNALRCKDDEVAELYLQEDIERHKHFILGVDVLMKRDFSKFYVLKKGGGRMTELVATFDSIKEFEDYQEQMYEKYVNEKK